MPRSWSDPLQLDAYRTRARKRRNASNAIMVGIAVIAGLITALFVYAFFMLVSSGANWAAEEALARTPSAARAGD